MVDRDRARVRGRSHARCHPYSPTFLAQVQAGNVSTVIAQDAAIRGTLKRKIRYPAQGKNVRPAKEFTTRVPAFADTKALDALLQRRGSSSLRSRLRAPLGGSRCSRASGPRSSHRPVVLGHAALRQREHVLARQREGEKVRADDGGVTFADVAGIDEAKQELAEVVDFLRDPEKYRKLGARIPRGVLLTGSPAPARPARTGRRRRGGRAVLLHVRLGVRGDDRRRRRLSRPRPLHPG